MLQRIALMTAALLAAGCAGKPPPPPRVAEAPPPPPAVVSDQAAADTDAVDTPAVPEAPQKPQQTDAGRFRVSIASTETSASAQAWAKKAEAAGYRTEILPVQIDGKSWQRVLLPGYASLAEAQAALPFIDQDLGVKSWVTSRRRAPTPDGAPVEAAAAPASDPAMPAPEMPAASEPAATQPPETTIEVEVPAGQPQN